MFLEVDGFRYRVAYKREMRRGFEFQEGRNAGESVAHNVIFDTIGVNYTYDFEIDPDPRYPTDYDELVSQLSRPARKHLFTVPDGAQGMTTFDGYITSLSDNLYGDDPGTFSTVTTGTINRWHGLRVGIAPVKPIRTPLAELRLVSLTGPTQKTVGNEITWTLSLAGVNGSVTVACAGLRDGESFVEWTEMVTVSGSATEADISLTLPAAAVTEAGSYQVRISASTDGDPHSLRAISDAVTVVESVS